MLQIWEDNPPVIFPDLEHDRPVTMAMLHRLCGLSTSSLR